MAKQSGLGSAFFHGVYDISGDVGSIQTAEITRALLPATGIDKSAEERTTGRRDGSLSFNTWWNTSAGQAQAVLETAPTTDVMVSWFVGSTVGAAAASMVAKQTTMTPSLGADGSLVIACNCLANGYGLEWGEMLTTGKQTFASGSLNGTSIDLGSTSTLFGAAGYLHVFSVGSGTPTVTIADSADNSSFTAVTGMAFTASPAATTERKQGAVGATVRRYVRVQVTGTYTNLVCAVNFVRYTESFAT